MHDCDAEEMVGQKGAQLGFTVVGLNKSFYNIDILGNSVLYVLPTSTPDASNFSTSRFDPALELSPHLRGLFSDVKNIGHKRAGSASLFIRGSRSRSQLKSIPVSVVIIDEADEMVQANIGLIHERMSGQLQKQSFKLSTPTIEHYGINRDYQASTQDHYFFPCPKCSRLTELIFPDCLVITAEAYTDPRIKESHLICKECKNTLPHKDKPTFLKDGQWISGYTDREIRGFHISQLYSSTVTPAALAIAFLKGQENQADEQEFFNSKLGLPHEPEGARLSDAIIKEAMGSYKQQDVARPHAIVTLGADVGKWIHYEITEYTRTLTSSADVSLASQAKVISMGKVEHFEELDAKVKQYGVNYAVVDAQPERRKALEFAQRFWGHVRLCYYGRGLNNKNITLHDQAMHTMTVDRTSWLDLSLGRFRRSRISLPVDTPLEYREHLKNLVRIVDKDSDGNPVAKYVKTGDDHYAHARCYNELALQLAASFAQSHDIQRAP
jgi:hypothetical protein